jgi:hypothetical protein
MFNEDFLNSLLHPPGNNSWLAHLTNQNYRTQLLRQSNYLLGFVSPNKYSLEIAIKKKWPDNQNDLEEDYYKSPTFVYCRETNTMVPLVRSNLQTPPKMQGSWNNNNTIMPKAMVESFRGVDGEPHYKKSWFFKRFNLIKVSTLTKRMFTLTKGMGHERYMVLLVFFFT